MQVLLFKHPTNIQRFYIVDDHSQKLMYVKYVLKTDAEQAQAWWHEQTQINLRDKLLLKILPHMLLC